MKILLAALAVWPIIAGAGPLSEPLTVGQFIKDFRPVAKPTPDEFLRYQKAQGFIDGVKAVTVGVMWCYDPTQAQVELDNEIVDNLKSLPTQEPAGPAILSQLILKHPCMRERKK